MCSICTTSYGDDRYGPIYSGRYGFQGNAPGQTPWEKNDPNCPGCRVGAFAAGEARPPMPGVTNVKPAGQMMGYGPNVAYVDPSSGMEMARAYPVGMGSCPPGTYMTGMGACVPYPAGQTMGPYVPVRINTVGFINEPGMYASWLTHNGISCNQWASMPVAQQLQYLRNFIFGAAYGIAVPVDSYNANIRNVMGGVVNGTRGEIVLLRQRGSSMAPASVPVLDSYSESNLRSLLNAINADCLRQAIQATNAPQPTGIPRTTGVRPAGQPLNDGPVPSSMASYAQNGRPFNAAPTRGTTMPPGFPLGFLPVGAGLDIPRGSMPMSPPAHILEPMVQWFGFQLK